MIATGPLPPPQRDFEIYRLNRVEHVSTYQLATRFEISQTRVRQVVHRTGQWLAGRLPAPSDLEKQQEARLAQCLAADQLQSQIEKLQVFWEQTRDPKFLRQQTRLVLALARLGVVPGAIDAAAAEVLDEDHSLGISPVPEKPEPLGPAAIATDSPNGDCSPSASERPTSHAAREASPDVSPERTTTSAAADQWIQEDLEALKLIEQRLLTLLEGTRPGDNLGREELEKTLANIRRERATIEVRISPQIAGAQMIGLTSHAAVA